MRELPMLRFFVYITSFLSSVTAFSVTLGTPTQCDPYTVSWTGGQAPFEILFTPKFSPLYNVSVPSSAFTNGKGSYTIPELPFANTTEFIVTMSDGTGFATGGTSTLQTVGSPVENNNCNTKLTQDFTFELNMQLKQCAWFNVTNYTGAILPVNIGILIPGGVATLFQNENTTDFGWIADVAEGTSLLFFVTDSQGRQGGVSDLEQVADSTDASCLVANPPSSTVSVASPTSSQSSFSSSSSTPNAGVIAGAVVGGVAFIALVIILGICCRRRMSRSSNVESYEVRLPRKDDDPEVKQYGQTFPSQYQTDGQTGNVANLTASEPLAHLRQTSYTDSFAGDSSISSASRLMPGMAVPTSPHAFAHQAYPAGLSSPTAANNVPVDENHTLYNQIQSSGQVSNPAASSRYGNTAGPPSRRAAPLGGQTISPNYSFPYQAPFSSYFSPPGAVPHRTSPGSSTINDPASPTNPMQPPRLNSNVERFVRPGTGSTSPGAQTSPSTDHHPTQIIMHTDVDDFPALSNAKSVDELPPQYSNRNLPVLPEKS